MVFSHCLARWHFVAARVTRYDHINVGDDSIDMVILDIDMGYLVTLVAAAPTSMLDMYVMVDPAAISAIVT